MNGQKEDMNFETYVKQAVIFPPLFRNWLIFLFHEGLATSWKTFFHYSHYEI